MVVVVVVSSRWSFGIQTIAKREDIELLRGNVARWMKEHCEVKGRDQKNDERRKKSFFQNDCATGISIRTRKKAEPCAALLLLGITIKCQI